MDQSDDKIDHLPPKLDSDIRSIMSEIALLNQQNRVRPMGISGPAFSQETMNYLRNYKVPNKK